MFVVQTSVGSNSKTLELTCCVSAMHMSSKSKNRLGDMILSTGCWHLFLQSVTVWFSTFKWQLTLLVKYKAYYILHEHVKVRLTNCFLLFSVCFCSCMKNASQICFDNCLVYCYCNKKKMNGVLVMSNYSIGLIPNRRSSCVFAESLIAKKKMNLFFIWINFIRNSKTNFSLANTHTRK